MSVMGDLKLVKYEHALNLVCSQYAYPCVLEMNMDDFILVEHEILAWCKKMLIGEFFNIGRRFRFIDSRDCMMFALKWK